MPSVLAPAPGIVNINTADILALKGPAQPPIKGKVLPTNNYSIPGSVDGKTLLLTWHSGARDYITITLNLRDGSNVLGGGNIVTIKPFSLVASSSYYGVSTYLSRSCVSLVYINGAWTMN